MKRKNSAILTYHSLDESDSNFSISPALFRAHLQTLASPNFHIVPLASVMDVPGSIALTFDDGYSNFLQVALPLLQEFRMPATVFVVSGYCGRLNEWRSRLPDPPRLPLLSWSEVREVAESGITIGAHTVHHADLTGLSSSDTTRELRDCRAQIEDHISRPVESFAYPYGATSPAVCELARSEFRLACGTRLEFANESSDPFNLPRIDAGYLRRISVLSRLDTWAGACYITARRQAAGIRGRLARPS